MTASHHHPDGRRWKQTWLTIPRQRGKEIIMPDTPDFTHGGEFIEWGDRTELDEHFPAHISLALDNIGMDVELVRWDRDQPTADEFEKWWTGQRSAIRRHVGTLTGRRLTIGRRTRKLDGAVICYVRINRTRPQAVAA